MQFPISGELRLPLLIMEWIFIITSFEISLIFLIRFFKQENTLKNYQDIGYFSFFAGFSLMWFFYIIADYYTSATITSPFLIWNNGSERALFLNFGYFTIIIAVFILLYGIEKYNVILFKKFIFTVIFSICAILFLILFFIDIKMTQLVSYFFWIIFLIFFNIYLIKFNKNLHKKGFFLFGGLSFMLIGFLFATDPLIEVLGLQIRFIGAIMQLISVIIFSYFFLTLPPFSEFDWKDKVEAVFIVNNAGICLYYKIFKEAKDLMDENLISSAITSINIMLQQLIESEKYNKDISVLKKKNHNVIIYPGKFVSGVLFILEELNFPKIVLSKFVDRFETLYRNILPDWIGDITIFKPTEILVNDMFFEFYR